MSTPAWRTFARFNIVGALGIVVQLATLAALTELGGLPYLPATVLAVSTALGHNFVWHWRWTWRDRSDRLQGVDRAFARFVLLNGVVSLVSNVGIMATLTGAAGMPPVPSNVVAIAVSGLVNFWLADRVVFWAPSQATG